MLDYLVIGFGIAGSCITTHLEGEGKSVFVIDGDQTKASEVAAGIYNPVVLRRFTLAWQANEQLNYANTFYTNLEAELKLNFNESLSVLRKFNSAEEQNKWFSKIDTPELANYLSPYLVSNPTSAINAPFKYGQVLFTGRILIKKMLQAYIKQLVAKERYILEQFDYEQLKIFDDCISYKNIKAKKVIFCEGFGLKNNPFFNHLPLIGNKGSYLIIKCEGLQLKAALKSHFFLVPLGNDVYKFGATYAHHIKGENYEKEATEQLKAQLDLLISASYKIIDLVTGVRPTVIDRRPMVGQHPDYSQLYIMNGMGTRGVMIAPTASKYLVNLLVHNIPLPQEINCQRFKTF